MATKKKTAKKQPIDRVALARAVTAKKAGPQGEAPFGANGEHLVPGGVMLAVNARRPEMLTPGFAGLPWSEPLQRGVLEVVRMLVARQLELENELNEVCDERDELAEMVDAVREAVG